MSKNIGRTGQASRRRLTPEDLAAEERRREALRLMVQANGGAVSYAARVGITRGVINNMLAGVARVSDRALGMANGKPCQANAAGGRFDDGGVGRAGIPGNQ